MAYVDVTSWSAEHVVGWLRGLHPSLVSVPMDLVIQNHMNGKRLLLSGVQEILDLLPPIKIETSLAISEGLKLIQHLTSNATRDTLQLLTLNLSCAIRYLQNQLIHAEHSPRILPVSVTSASPMTGTGKNRFDFAKVDSNIQINQSTKQRVSLETLECVSIVVDRMLQVIDWINSLDQISGLNRFKRDFKDILLRVSIELVSTAQRDQFVDRPNNILKRTSRFLADYADWIVLSIDDPDFIQPCWIDVVSVKKKPEEDDFGFSVQPTITGLVIIENIVFSAPAHRSGGISFGDEILQIDYQTVVGWPPEVIQERIKSFKSELILTIRKKPTQSSFNPGIVKLKPYEVPLKRISSHNSDTQSYQEDSSSISGVAPTTSGEVDEEPEVDLNLEQPKEPKGPVYTLRQPRGRRELKRRVSISGSIPDALVELGVADSLPIPSYDNSPTNEPAPQPEISKLSSITKETLTKSISHDTAKLYLHTQSIERKHLWMPDRPKKPSDPETTSQQ